MIKLRNKKKTAKFLIIPLIGLFLAPFSLRVNDTGEKLAFKLAFADEKSDLAAQKQQKQNELAELNRQIDAYNDQIAVKRKQTASLSNEIALYNIEIKSTELQIQATNTNIDNTGIQITQTKQQIQERTIQMDQEKKILSELLLTLHEYDATSSLQISLGSDNFSDFMDQIQYTESVQEKVFSLLQQIKQIKEKLEQDEKELEINLEKLNQLNEQLQKTESTLNDQKSSKTALLTQTKGQESQYQKLLSLTQAEQAKINNEIYELDSKIQGKKGFKSLPAIHGILAWPMDGVVTQKYGNTGFTSLGYTFHNGLDLAAPAGTSIYAAADGTIEAVGKGEAAYGNWVAIRHPVAGKLTKEIITLYAHMISYRVSPGQAVKAGDLIGYEGNTGNTTRLLYGPDRGYHLHFTVFDAEGFGIAQGAYPKIYGPYRVPYGYTYNPMDFL